MVATSQLGPLTPDGVLLNESSAWANVGGAASIQAALADALDSTYAEASGSADNNKILRTSLSTTTLPAGAQIHSYKVLSRGGRSSFGETPRIYVSTNAGGTIGDYNPGYGVIRGATFIVYNSQTLAMVQATIDALYVSHYTTGLSAGAARLYLAWVYFYYVSKPTVTVNNPTGTITTTMQPTADWSFTQAEGNPQATYRVKVFDSATYGGGGFNADTSTPAWDSGEVTSPNVSVQIATALTNGTTYKAYVKSSVDVEVPYNAAGDRLIYSDWAAGPAFTISVSPPPAPTLSTSADATNGRIGITVNRGGTTPATDGFFIERSKDAGATWTNVRLPSTANGLVVVTPGVAQTVYDYEMPIGVGVRYRARAYDDVTGGRVFSTYTTQGSDTTLAVSDLTSNGLWLKVPQDDTKNMRVELTPGSLNFKRPKDSAVFNPIGRPRKVQVEDVVKGVEFTGLEFDIVGSTAYDKLTTIYETQKVVLLQTDIAGRQWYLSLGDWSEKLINAVDRVHYVSFDAVEVDSP
jgi:hypothetical protein